MGTLNIKDIQEGMELEEDIVNFNGVVLLKAGSILSEKHLTAIRAWGITEANIKGIEKDALEEQSLEKVDPATVTKIDQNLKKLFKKTDLEDPIIDEIYRLVKKIKLQAL